MHCEVNIGERVCGRPASGTVVLHADVNGFRPDFFSGKAVHTCEGHKEAVTHPHEDGRVTFLTTLWAHKSNGPTRKAFTEALVKGGR